MDLKLIYKNLYAKRQEALSGASASKQLAITEAFRIKWQQVVSASKIRHTKPKGWVVADWDTKEAFNKWGAYPYDAIFTRKMSKPNQPLLDITILYNSDTKDYTPCHGGVRMKDRCKTTKEAAEIAEAWAAQFMKDNHESYSRIR